MSRKRKIVHDESGIDVPPEISKIGFDFPRDLEKIHALELPVEDLSIEELEWHLDLPFFWQYDKPFSLRPRDVLENPESYVYRMKRIMSVDEIFPIDIMFWKERWEILDGLHRLCKQILQGKKIVEVRKIPVEWKERIMPD